MKLEASSGVKDTKIHHFHDIWQRHLIFSATCSSSMEQSRSNCQKCKCNVETGPKVELHEVIISVGLHCVKTGTEDNKICPDSLYLNLTFLVGVVFLLYIRRKPAEKKEVVKVENMHLKIKKTIFF